jgi:hypothetical protein
MLLRIFASLTLQSVVLQAWVTSVSLDLKDCSFHWILRIIFCCLQRIRRKIVIFYEERKWLIDIFITKHLGPTKGRTEIFVYDICRPKYPLLHFDLEQVACVGRPSFSVDSKGIDKVNNGAENAVALINARSRKEVQTLQQSSLKSSKPNLTSLFS